MKLRSKIVWFVLLALLLFAFWLVSGAKASQHDRWPTKGDGAHELVVGAMLSYQQSAILPKATTEPLGTCYFIVTATDKSGQTSERSNEAVFYKTKPTRMVDLSWERPSCTNVITNYTVFMGKASGQYPYSSMAGTNLTLTWGQTKTNKVIHITGTNMSYKSPSGIWNKLPASQSSISITNPMDGGMLWKGSGMKASVTWQ